MKTTKRYAPTGYVYVDRQLAAVCYSLGFDVTMHGNNVNSYHVFDGWHLGYTVNETDINAREDNWTFEKLTTNFLFNLEPELGRYPVFCISEEDYSLYREVTR